MTRRFEIYPGKIITARFVKPKSKSLYMGRHKGADVYGEGTYNEGEAVVYINRELTGHELARTIRHELLHAYSYFHKFRLSEKAICELEKSPIRFREVK